MKKTLFSLSTLALLGLTTPTMAHVPALVAPSLAPMLDRVTPAVVNIAVAKLFVRENPENDNVDIRRGLAVGSGVIIDAKKGYILTNAHVVKNDQAIIITLKDGRRYRADIVGVASQFDLALLHITAPRLTAMHIGNSDTVQAGDFVVAVGSPFGLTQTVTSGIVSALHRSTPGLGFQDYIQTDAPINPGNSGGALINLQGELVGVNTAIISETEGNVGIGLAIPAHIADRITDQLIRFGKVKAGVLGVFVQNLSPELAHALQLPYTATPAGVVVTEVMPRSPAAKAGLQLQDVIQSLDDTPMTSASQLRNWVAISRPGAKITLSVRRASQTLRLPVTLTDAKTLANTAKPIPYLDGVRLQTFSDIEPDGSLLSGALVLDLDDSSAAALAGLVPGDVVTNANGKSITTADDLMSISRQTTQSLLLRVNRGTGNLFIVIMGDKDPLNEAISLSPTTSLASETHSTRRSWLGDLFASSKAKTTLPQKNAP